jgi:hypothetical protein
MGFSTDLNFGKIYENKFVKIMKFKDYKVIDGKCLEFDIVEYEDGDETLYEVKADRKAQHTQNMCFEFESNGCPSGIATSKSHFYGYFILFDNGTYDLYVIPTWRIKRYVRKGLYSRIQRGCEYGKNKFYLFQKDMFLKYKMKIKQ